MRTEEEIDGVLDRICDCSEDQDTRFVHHVEAALCWILGDYDNRFPFIAEDPHDQ